MLREINTKAFAWPDRTMSGMQQRQLEACEQRLAGLPAVDPFGGCSDREAEEVWRVSFDAQEHPGSAALHTAAGLREQVLRLMPTEALLLPMHEAELLGRCILSGGKTPLSDWSESAPAESLVRRLWCSVARGEDGVLVLHAAPAVGMRMLEIAANEPFQERRGRVLRFYLTVMCALNTCGMLRADAAMDYLRRTALNSGDVEPELLARRALRTAFDYTYAPDGAMVLLHPGLADPHPLLAGIPEVRLEDYAVADPDADIPQMLLSDGERSAAYALAGLIDGSLRPDIPTQMAVEDLRALAKQDVSLQAMQEVLAAQLMTRPTAAMTEALALLRAQTPGWLCVPTRMVQ